MGILNKYNKGALFNYDNEKERDFIKLSDLYQKFGADTEYIIHAIFINTKSKFGDAPVFVTDNYMVNISQHMLQPVQELLEDDDAVQLINNRKAGFKIYTFSGRNGKGYSVEFVEYD